MNSKHFVNRFSLRVLLATCVTSLLLACSSSPERPKPAELPPSPGLLGVRLAWSAKLGDVQFPLDVRVNDRVVTLASSDGTVASIDATTGAELWRTQVGTPIAAGVGSDGHYASVVSRSNELITLEAGRELWRQSLNAQGFTAPLVAGERVFVLTADRTVIAFDARSGRKLWTQQRSGDPLVLRQAGIMLAVGDTLVVGQSGRLVGMNPLNGSIRWEAPIATPRGTNDVERLVDLVAHVNRQGDVVCARAFQAAVGCVNAAKGTVLWTQAASGSEGLAGDENFVFGTEADGKVIAWQRKDGERAWVSERLRYRGLTTPQVVGRSIVIGDSTGLVHLLSRADGSALTRVATDGSAVVSAPVLAGNTLVVVTRRGGVFGFQPE